MKHNKLYNLNRVRYGFNQNEENQKVFHGKEFFFLKKIINILQTVKHAICLGKE